MTAARRARPVQGTTIGFTLSEPASVMLSVQRKRAGRTVAGRCVKVTKANRRQPYCTRFGSPQRFARLAAAGTTTTPFSGRIGASTLSPGPYRIMLVATDAAGNRSQPVRLRIRVVS